MGAESIGQTVTLNWDNAQKLVDDPNTKAYHPNLSGELNKASIQRVVLGILAGFWVSLTAGVIVFAIGASTVYPTNNILIPIVIGSSVGTTVLVIFGVYFLRKYVKRNKKIEDDKNQANSPYLAKILTRDIEFSKRCAATSMENSRRSQNHLNHLQKGDLPSNAYNKEIEARVKLPPQTTLTWKEAEKITEDPEVRILVPNLFRVLRVASELDDVFFRRIETVLVLGLLLGAGIGFVVIGGSKVDLLMISGVALTSAASTGLLALAVYSVLKALKLNLKIEEDGKSEARPFLAEILRKDIPLLEENLRQNPSLTKKYGALRETLVNSTKLHN